jgi:hypothetical protein
MPELKSIQHEAIPAAIEKAVRYRLLNEPREAESICRDVLRADAENQDALAHLLLALTDQFGREFGVDLQKAQEILPRFHGMYERAYYAGVILERWGKAMLSKGAAGYAALDWIRQAMKSYEQAEALRPPDNDDAILRWNTCARVLNRDDRLGPAPAGAAGEHDFGDEVPMI